jgi:nucleoid-associated protein YgaU
VSGVSFTIDATKEYVNGELYPDSTYYAPAQPGVRVTNVTVNGKALDLTANYVVATNDFTAAGGDTYGVFKGKAINNLDLPMEDALVNYTREVLGNVVSAEKYGEAAGRITILTAPAEPEAPAAETYTVVAGDCLWNIAAKTLGNGAKWNVIFEANKDIIKDASLIYVGQVLTIPAA